MKNNSEKTDEELSEKDLEGDNFMVRILVLLNENSPVVPALLFLKKQGYKIKAVYRLMDAINELSTNKPEVLLISWNLKKTDVRKAYGLLSKKFDTLCVVFGEENSKKTSAALMGSGIPHTLLPPVSGPGIHMRVQSLLRKRRMHVGERRATDFNDDINSKSMPKIITSQTQMNDKGKIDFDLIKGNPESVKSEDVPLDTHWESIGENVWRGESKKEKKFYYFKGADAPTLDAKKKQWQGFGKVDVKMSKENIDNHIKSQLVFEDDLTKLDGYSGDNLVENEIETLMQVANLEEDSERDSKKKKGKSARDDKSDKKLIDLLESEYEALTVLRPKSEKTGLSKGVQKAVATAIKPNRKNKKKPLNVTTKVTVTMIKTSQFQGYLVGANADDIPDIELMKEVLKHLGTTLQDIGEAMDIKTKVLELEVDPIPFMIWVDSKAEFFVTSHHGENEVAYAYLPFLNMPVVVDAETDEALIGIKLSSIYPNKPVPFKVYIYMPKNNKYLLYLKSGAKADTKILSKLIKFGVKHVYLSREDEEVYHTYCAKYKIAEAYEDFKKVG